MTMPKRITAIILCLFLWILSTEAQDSLLYQPISIKQTRCTLDEAIRIVGEKSNLSFSYNSDLIDKKKEILLEADNKPLIALLKEIFNDPSLSYSIIGRHLVIYRPYRARAVNPESVSDSVYYFMISGKVFDNETRLPISFSSVYLLGKTTGTISNEEGEFQLKLRYEDIDETLGISSIGYKTFSAPVSELVNSTNSYYLETDIVPIQEVIIRRISPVLLLENANARIRDNYPREPVVLSSFYRETVQKGSRYTMVSEAILHHFKTGYSNIVPDRVKIIKGRKNESINNKDSVLLKLKAGLNTMIILDVVKNIPDFLTGRSIADYQYRLTDIVVEDNRDHYAIEFLPRSESPNGAMHSGRIIIDINDMAFKWVEFQVSQELLDRATDQFIVRKPANLIVKVLKANYKVAFRKTGNKYYLHLIQCETGFRIREKRQLSGTNYFTRLEMAVMDIDTLNTNRFPQRESAKPLEFFSEQVGDYDASFWGEYNFIAPDESLENALSRLRKINNREQ